MGRCAEIRQAFGRYRVAWQVLRREHRGKKIPSCLRVAQYLLRQLDFELSLDSQQQLDTGQTVEAQIPFQTAVERGLRQGLRTGMKFLNQMLKDGQQRQSDLGFLTGDRVRRYLG